MTYIIAAIGILGFFLYERYYRKKLTISRPSIIQIMPINKEDKSTNVARNPYVYNQYFTNEGEY